MMPGHIDPLEDFHFGLNQQTYFTQNWGIPKETHKCLGASVSSGFMRAIKQDCSRDWLMMSPLSEGAPFSRRDDYSTGRLKSTRSPVEDFS